MFTLATVAEYLEIDALITRPMLDCVAAHRALAARAHALSRRLAPSSVDESDLLRLGATCIELSMRDAVVAHLERDLLRSWDECARGERQIRRATFRGLRSGRLTEADYDQTFRAAAVAARARSDEMLRLRRRLRYLAVT